MLVSVLRFGGIVPITAIRKIAEEYRMSSTSTKAKIVHRDEDAQLECAVCTQIETNFAKDRPLTVSQEHHLSLNRKWFKG